LRTGWLGTAFLLSRSAGRSSAFEDTHPKQPAEILPEPALNQRESDLTESMHDLVVLRRLRIGLHELLVKLYVLLHQLVPHPVFIPAGWA
jgi:hypothetical protein